MLSGRVLLITGGSSGLARRTAIALGKHGIHRNSMRHWMEARIPLGRLGKADGLAGPILFPASDMTRYATGAALLVDGGALVKLQ